MPDNPPLSKEQQEISDTYVPILLAYLEEDTGGADVTFDHFVNEGELVGFEWATSDGTKSGIVNLYTLDKYLDAYTVRYFGGVKHGEVEQGQGEPEQEKTVVVFGRPSIFNTYTHSAESSLYELRITDGRYEYHALKSWTGMPSSDAKE